jgi:hypothetical protein
MIAPHRLVSRRCPCRRRRPADLPQGRQERPARARWWLDLAYRGLAPSLFLLQPAAQDAQRLVAGRTVLAEWRLRRSARTASRPAHRASGRVGHGRRAPRPGGRRPGSPQRCGRSGSKRAQVARKGAKREIGDTPFGQQLARRVEGSPAWSARARPVALGTRLVHAFSAGRNVALHDSPRRAMVAPTETLRSVL